LLGATARIPKKPALLSTHHRKLLLLALPMLRPKRDTATSAPRDLVVSVLAPAGRY
jgi:hypothetical protein